MKSSGANFRQFDFLLIDGYNIIHDWESLAALAQTSLELARDKLVNMVANYQGYRDIQALIVFDAHKIRFGHENIIHYGNVTLVYTAESETADAYIERAIANLTRAAKPYRIAVATSDNIEQVIIMAKGAYRLSARDLLEEIETAEAEIRRKIAKSRPIKNNQLSDNLTPEMADWLEKMRLKKEL
ncbi:MAG: NYN domain-containing protein [Defluviitaleaceae bacterium]|nr:NYN domain-containing protein [Defluviitaleaceae bacterium]